MAIELVLPAVEKLVIVTGGVYTTFMAVVVVVMLNKPV